MKISNSIYWYILIVGMSLLLIACSRKNTASVTLANRVDSSKATDSSAQMTVLHVKDTLAYEQRQGKYMYKKYCAVCHGEEGRADGFNAFNLDPKPRDFTDEKYMNSLSDERITQAISGGGRTVNLSPLMPSWGGRITKGEIKFLLAYLRLFPTAHRP